MSNGIIYYEFFFFLDSVQSKVVGIYFMYSVFIYVGFLQ